MPDTPTPIRDQGDWTPNVTPERIADARDVPEVDRQVSCNSCGNYFHFAHMTSTGLCQACAARTGPSDSTTPVSAGFDDIARGDYVRVTDVYDTSTTGQYIAHQASEEGMYRGASTVYTVLLVVDRRRRTHTISQMVADHPEFLPPSTPIGDIHDMLNGNPNGYAFCLARGVQAISSRTAPAPLRPCDGVYFSSELNSLDGTGGEVPLPTEQSIDRVAMIIQRGGGEDAEDYGYTADWYEAWIPATGEHVWFNQHNTLWTRVFQATEQNWCSDRRRPILALAAAMRNEYEQWQVEDRGGYDS